MTTERIIIVIVGVAILVVLFFAFTAEAKEVSKRWFISTSLENAGGASFGGLKYQKTIDEAEGVVCYTAVGAKSDVAISCVER